MLGETVKDLFEYFGLKVSKVQNYKKIQLEALRGERLCKKLKLLSFLQQNRVMQPDTISGILDNLDKSESQSGQDIVALVVAGQRKKGFFVEFGACDGRILSNTYLLEKYYGWSGVLAEPARTFHAALVNNRNCMIDFSFVGGDRSEVHFLQTKRPELSTRLAFAKRDFHFTERTRGISYKVPTISLMNLLERHGAPSEIDFLSIDVEGGELEALEDFDFDKYKFSFISIEHNFSESRKPLANLMNTSGYYKIMEDFSGVDDWYVPMESFETQWRRMRDLNPR